MTDDPWTCGDGCPFKGCPECVYKGVDNVGPFATTWENRSGNDERPTAPTVDRSSRSDSLTREGGAYLTW